VRRGDKTLFWEDVWLGSSPLKIQFPDLYRFCDDPNILVKDCFGEEGWEIDFRRILTVNEAEQRTALMQVLQEVVITHLLLSVSQEDGSRHRLLWNTA
jgi:hypothetical protein